MTLPVKISDWPAEWLELWNERAGIMEAEGKMLRWRAEREAERDIRKLESRALRRAESEP
jgi:hypothetical protein